MEESPPFEFGKVILKTRVGSHLYGLNRPDSDEDFVSVFIPHPEYLLGLKNVEEVDRSTKSSKTDRRNTEEDKDDKSYALAKFVRLLFQNNPNVLELLFTNYDNMISATPEFKELQANYHRIVSKEAYKRFMGYAYEQRKKLEVKANRYKGLVEAVDWLETCHSFSIRESTAKMSEQIASFLNETVKHYKGLKGNTESFHVGLPVKTVYEKLRDERDKYGWRVKTDSFDKLAYDIKFGYHLIRLMVEAEELITTGRLFFPIRDNEDIIRVRNGDVELDELYHMYDERKARVDRLFETCDLRKSADWKWANKYVYDTHLHHILNLTNC